MISGALINAFHITLVDRPDAHLILDRALQRLHVPNVLAPYIVENNINRRRAMFHSIEAHGPELDIFPVMTMPDLVLFALGIYQIKQARSYYGEHTRERGSFMVEVSNNVEPIDIIPETAHSSHKRPH